MKYSVLMSVYKNDNPIYLRDALKSIYDDQVKKPDEIVVVFDGPLTEHLYKELELFRKDKEDVVFYYPQEINRGLGEALKIGAEYCTGDYIFRMDSDDISESHRFEKQAEYVEKHPETDVLGTDIAEFNNDLKEQMKIRRCPAEHDAVVKMSKTRSPMNHVTVCIKRSALEKSGGYETLLLLEDYYLWLRMIASGCRFANINESLVFVRTGDGFLTRRSSTVRIKGWKVLQKYMLKHKMINVFGAAMNMVYIRVITFCPSWLRKFLYENILRKK